MAGTSTCLEWLNVALEKLLAATLESESLSSTRDLEVAAVQAKFAPRIKAAELSAAQLEGQIKSYYAHHRGELEKEGQKSLQLEYGEISMRIPSTPALELLPKWNWPRVAKVVRQTWGARFFLKPAAPRLDKIKLKKDLSAAQLAKLGMLVDNTESCTIVLNRLHQADHPPKSEAA